MEPKTYMAFSATPPKLQVQSSMAGWTALLLAVSHHAEVAVYDLLYQTPRSGRIILHARRLLIWGFRDVCDVDEPEAVAWLTMTMTAISKRTIQQILSAGYPEGLSEVIATYQRVLPLIGFDELREAVSAGVFGQRGERSRLWTKGFTESLGLRPM